MGVTPDRIARDGHDAYPRAIRAVFGDRVAHLTNRYLNNRLEQDHRGITQRHRPMGGLKRSLPLHASVASSIRSGPCSDHGHINFLEVNETFYGNFSRED
jgi:transposase-like protein